MGTKGRLVKFYSTVSDRSEVIHLISQLFSGDGGPGSGNHGHAGRPGKVGGSAPGKGGSGLDPTGGSEEKPKTRFPVYHAKEKIKKIDEEIDKIAKYVAGVGEEHLDSPEIKEASKKIESLTSEKEKLEKSLKEAEKPKEDRLKAPKEAVAGAIAKLSDHGDDEKIKTILKGVMGKISGDDVSLSSLEDALVRLEVAREKLGWIGTSSADRMIDKLYDAEKTIRKEYESGVYKSLVVPAEETVRLRPEPGSTREKDLRGLLEKAGHDLLPEKMDQNDWLEAEENAIKNGKAEELYGLYFSQAIQDTDWYDQLKSQYFNELSDREKDFLRYVDENTEGEDWLEKEYGFIYGDAPEELKKYYLCIMQKATGGGFPLEELTYGHENAPKVTEKARYSGDKKTKFGPPPDGAMKTLGNYQIHYGRELQFVKENYHLKQKDIKQAEGIVSQIFDQNEFGMFIEPQYIENALQDHFKNQMETGTSKGLYNPDRRRNVSSNLFGTKQENADPEDYEKYGCLMQNATAEGTGGRGYGGCSVIFKKDRMAGRVTYTLTDSLAAIGPAGSASVGSGNTLGGSYDPGHIVEQLKSIPPAKYGDLEAVLDALHSPYIELQYHGKLTVDDVQSIVFPSEKDCYSNLSNSMLKSLMDKGISVYYDTTEGIKNAEVGKSVKR